MPDEYAVSNASGLGIERFLDRLAFRLRQGLRWVQLREPGLDESTFAALFREVRALTAAHEATLLVNGMHPESFWHAADGVQLRAADTEKLKTRPDLPWVGVSCHSRTELEHAAALGADFAVLGNVKETPTHPQRPGTGWASFAEIAHEISMPVYAIGGLTLADLDTGRLHGAHGVATLRAAWS